MNKIHNFSDSILVGKFGEDIIINYLNNNLNIKEIKNVSSLPEYQRQDIDLIVYFKNNDNATIEIKTDTYVSGNIFFETISNLEHNVVGCMYKTNADYLFYYFTKTKELYILKTKDYIEWFKKNINHFKIKYLKNINKQNNGTYTSVGYTIPKIFLENNFKKYKKVIL